METNDWIAKYQATNQFGLAQGLELNIVSPGNIEYTMTVAASHLALPQAAHGGAIAGLMDAALSVAGLSATAPNNRVVSTVEFKITYFSAAQLDETLVAIGTVLQSGHRLLFTEATIKEINSERIVAKGSATLNTYPAEKSGL